ncbi:MAG: site-specific DNA-methyltransferase [Chitinophagaceae bacterium]|nr:site-specific DNA-methyltransferase [Chitinophagaceae bacterium]
MPILNFKGKTFVQNHHLAVKYHQLVPKKDLSITDKVSLHDNLIIQGDNLKALKALLPTYAGKIKCIYIDPPYNTGNENWVYNDNVNSPMIKEWLGNVVDKEDLTRHDKWLCMMMPRLKLLRELLSEDGVIFISIDDNEQHRLRNLLDEIFGEQNFIQNIIWQKKYSPQNDAKYFSDMHDFIVCYAKNKIDGEQKFGWERNLLERTSEMNERYSNPDNDKRGDWKSADFSVKTYSKDYDYEITLPSGRVVNPPQGRSWNTSKENFQKLVEDNRIWFGDSGNNVPSVKKFLTEVKNGAVPISIWGYKEVGHNQESKQELKEIFSEIQLPFDTPKPVRLLQRIIKLSTSSNDIILDSFAGSGTTAHAVLELNKEDGGNRKFILVEQEDYANTITAERVRRVIKGVKTAKSELLRKGTGGTFSYFELGGSIEMESILIGKSLPGYEELARYIFYTATGQEFNEKKINRKTNFIGETENYELYMLYEPDIDWLKQNALTLDGVRNFPKFKGKQRLVFAPAKYVDDYTLLEHRIDFCQLPYEIYRMQK